MDYFLYILLCVCAFSSIFLTGWQFGLWMQSLNDRKTMRELYTKKDDDFHNVYYADNKCKYTACCKTKTKKAKKNLKK
jgi:hypothetical protein